MSLYNFSYLFLYIIMYGFVWLRRRTKSCINLFIIQAQMLEEMDEEFGISELIDQTVPIKKEVLLNGFFEDAGISKIICVF